LIGASIYLLEQPRLGAVSNAYGFYSITAPAGNYTLIISFAGFHQDSAQAVLNKDISKVVELAQGGAALQEVVVSTAKRNENVVKPIMGVQKLSVKRNKQRSYHFW